MNRKKWGIVLAIVATFFTTGIIRGDREREAETRRLWDKENKITAEADRSKAEQRVRLKENYLREKVAGEEKLRLRQERLRQKRLVKPDKIQELEGRINLLEKRIAALEKICRVKDKGQFIKEPKEVKSLFEKEPKKVKSIFEK